MHYRELYPAPINHVCDVSARIHLSGRATTVEPTPYWGYVCASSTQAAQLARSFDAARYPTIDPDVFLMITSATNVPDDCYDERVEVTLVEFGNARDQRRFELALW